MPIQRISEGLDQQTNNNVVLLYGLAQMDEFIDRQLHLCNIEEIMWRYLKEQGFERIIFFDLEHKLYSYDEESIDLCPPVSDFLSERARTIREELDIDSIEEEDNLFKFNVNPGSYNVCINILHNILLDASIKTAVLFNNFEQTASRLNKETNLYDDLLAKIGKWISLSSDNKNICFLIYNYETEKELEKSVGGSPVLRQVFMSAKNKGLGSALVKIDTPQEDEIKRLIQKVRLTNHKHIEWSELEVVVSEMVREQRFLRNWNKVLKAFPGVSRYDFREIIPHIPHPDPDVEKKLALAELNEMVGLGAVKKFLHDYVKAVNIAKERVKKGLDQKLNLSGLSLVFTGNPGTGKTSVSRQLGRIFKSMGILKKGHVYETDGISLIGEYVGGTGPKFDKIIQDSLDGVLFIDEAYYLAYDEKNKRGNAFAKDVVVKLLKQMETYEDRLIIAIAGYPRQMKDFLESNPGLKSRFNRHIHFENYTLNELWDIFKKFAQESRYIILPGVEEKVKKYLSGLKSASDKESWGNAREVRNLFFRVRDNHHIRVDRMGDVDRKKKDLMLIHPSDIPEAPRSSGYSANAIIVIPEEKISIPIPEEHPLQNPDFSTDTESYFVKAVGIIKTVNGRGSAFLISPDGYLITCHHVIENSIEVEFEFEKENRTYVAQRIFSDPDTDLALLKIDCQDRPYFSLNAHTEEISRGTKVGLLSFPMGESLGGSAAYDSGDFNRHISIKNDMYLQIGTDGVRGSSGGAVFSLETGKIVGVLHGGMHDKLSSYTNFNLAIEIRHLFNFIHFIPKLTKEQIIVIKHGSKGFSYEKIFKPYLAEAENIQLTEPWMGAKFQRENLIEFCQLLDEKHGNKHFHLITKAHYRKSFTTTDQTEMLQRFFEKIKRTLAKKGVDFTFDFEENIHDRFLLLSNGWKASLGRGLHIFAKWNPRSSPNFASNQELRPCLDSHVTWMKKK